MQPDRHVPAASCRRYRRSHTQEVAHRIAGSRQRVDNLIDSAVAGMLGLAALIWAGVMSNVDALGLVDSNVMATLVSV